MSCAHETSRPRRAGSRPWLLLLLVAACGGAPSDEPADTSPGTDITLDEGDDPATTDDSAAADDDGSGSCCRPDATATLYAGRFEPVDPADPSQGLTLEPFGLVPDGVDRFILDTCGTYTPATATTPHLFDAAGCCPDGFVLDGVSSLGTPDGPNAYQPLTVSCLRLGDDCPDACPESPLLLPRAGWGWESTGPTTYAWQERSTCMTAVLDGEGKVVEVDASGCCPPGWAASPAFATAWNPGVVCHE